MRTGLYGACSAIMMGAAICVRHDPYVARVVFHDRCGHRDNLVEHGTMTSVFKPGASANISKCGTYRYRLTRAVPISVPACKAIAFIGINPSTADALQDDATIRKLKVFTAMAGASTLIVGNVFAFRATNVAELATADDPFGPENAEWLDAIAWESDVIVPMWGNLSKVPKRLHGHFGRVMTMLCNSRKPLLTFGLTKPGHPSHPLMLPYSTPLVPL